MPTTPFDRAAEAVDQILAQPHPTNGTIIVEAVLQALREPSEAMVAKVVQQVGDPSGENWALAERVCAILGSQRPDGEMACAELVRDWQAMIDAISAEAFLRIPRLDTASKGA